MRRYRNRSGHASTLYFLAFIGIIASLLAGAAGGLPPDSTARSVLKVAAFIVLSPMILFVGLGIAMWVIGLGFFGAWWLLAKLRLVKYGPCDDLLPEENQFAAEMHQIAEEAWDRVQSNQANRRY